VSRFNTLAIAGECVSQFGVAALYYCEDYVESSKFSFPRNVASLAIIDISNVNTVQIKQKSGNGGTTCQANFTMLLVPFNKDTKIPIL